MAKKIKKIKKPVASGGFGSQALTTDLAHAEALIRRKQWV